MRYTTTFVALMLCSALVVAGPPKRKGPPSDLVAAPPSPPTPVFFPLGVYPHWGYYGNRFFLPFPGFYTEPPVVLVPQPVPTPPATTPPSPTRVAEAAARASAQVPATLTLELPAAADVWVNGEKQSGSATATRTLLSPPLKLGAEYRFRIRAEWVEDGTKYEATPTSTVRAGELGKITVYAGSVVK